jgi:surface-anchored protein
LLTSLAPPVSAASIYSLGHGDIRFRYSGGVLYQVVHLDPESIIDGAEVGNAPNGENYFPDLVTTLVPDPPLPRPEGPEWAFIGNGAGDPVWLIPEVQEYDRPWLGISTESLDPAKWSNFRLRLVDVSGPAGGHFSLSDSGGIFFARVFFATSDGIDGADQFEPILGSHAHYSWLFSKPGTYDISLEITGQHETGGLLSSVASYRFDVIPEPSAAASVLLAAGATLFVRRRRVSGGCQ